MIRIRVSFTGDDGGGEELTVEASGHAGYAPGGRDIVCAGVSALLYGYLSYLEWDLAEHPGSGRMDRTEKDGYLAIHTVGMNGRDRTAFRVIAAGLRRMEAAFPAFVTVGDWLPEESGIVRGRTEGETERTGG